MVLPTQEELFRNEKLYFHLGRYWENLCLLIFRAVFVDYLEYSYDRDHFSLAVLEIRLEGLHRSLYNWEESIYHLLNEFFFFFCILANDPLTCIVQNSVELNHQGCWLLIVSSFIRFLLLCFSNGTESEPWGWAWTNEIHTLVSFNPCRVFRSLHRCWPPAPD